MSTLDDRIDSQDVEGQDSTIREAAQRLADANAAAEPAVREIFLFPDDEMIRLIEVDETTIPSDEIIPFYFGPDPVGGFPFPMGIALILPDEKDLEPPMGWGSWEKAIRIFHRD